MNHETAGDGQEREVETLTLISMYALLTTGFLFLYHHHVAHHQTTNQLSEHYNQPEQCRCTRDR
jgi:fatty acid desaturase